MAAEIALIFYSSVPSPSLPPTPWPPLNLFSHQFSYIPVPYPPLPHLIARLCVMAAEITLIFYSLVPPPPSLPPPPHPHGPPEFTFTSIFLQFCPLSYPTPPYTLIILAKWKEHMAVYVKCDCVCTWHWHGHSCFALNTKSTRRSDLTLWFCYVVRRAKELIEQKRIQKAREEAEVTVPLLSSSVSLKYTKLCAFLMSLCVCVCVRMCIFVSMLCCCHSLDSGQIFHRVLTMWNSQR